MVITAPEQFRRTDERYYGETHTQVDAIQNRAAEMTGMAGESHHRRGSRVDGESLIAALRGRPFRVSPRPPWSGTVQPLRFSVQGVGGRVVQGGAPFQAQGGWREEKEEGGQRRLRAERAIRLVGHAVDRRR
ncbi:hypothetical protein THAOC_04169 [Thalassiosira oceanica]|uniref:Uncharacterized protein n=1 Tax=Thalassiosira oceanica TaxID=159749 RepID=K0TP61_THAOC|nr:hypothetical protein THAOC_04169 [Thalassiosira oceanica]|eukprot:EJK74172.1 hypothetical protein THAOC_04169 [Thalassiosira oceanica]